MRIGTIDLAREVLIVAEIGNNHEGDFGRAVEMVQAAAAAGAQAVKFQTIVPERLVRPDQTARLAQLRRFAFTPAQFAALAEEAGRAGVLFMSTPFCLEAVDWLDPLVPAFKIASGDNDFLPLIEKVSATGKPIVLSTGMSDAAGLARTVAHLARLRPAPGGRVRDLALLHCVSAYPTPPEAANLGAIAALAAHGVPGYSDHTLGIEAAVLSVALGARVIEKHFTLCKTASDFRDHQLSADPAELAELVARVRGATVLLGDGQKRVAEPEVPVVAAGRRSVCAVRDLPEGHRLAMADFAWLRPGDGLPPGREADLVGRTLRTAMRAGEPFQAELVA